MSVDRRLRQALDRSFPNPTPDVDAGLNLVERKARRAKIRDRVVGTAVVVVIAAALTSMWPLISSFERKPSPGDGGRQSLLDSFAVDLSGRGGALQAAGLDGPWTIAFNGDGTIRWSPPPGSGINDALPRDTFQSTDGTLVTSLFQKSLCRGQGVGTYAWSRSGDRLVLRTVDDECALRRVILSAEAWTAT